MVREVHRSRDGSHIGWCSSRRFVPSVTGLVLAFPFIIGSRLVFFMSSGRETFRATTIGVLWDSCTDHCLDNDETNAAAVRDRTVRA